MTTDVHLTPPTTDADIAPPCTGQLGGTCDLPAEWVAWMDRDRAWSMIQPAMIVLTRELFDKFCDVMEPFLLCGPHAEYWRQHRFATRIEPL